MMLSNLSRVFREGQTIWVSDWGNLPVSEDELRAAGLREKRSGWRNDKNYRILGDFISMYLRDES